MAIFRGSGVAMVTPFDANGVNYDALSQLIEHLIKGKTDAIIALGTTGEPSCMSQAEREQVLRFTVEKVNKRVPVIAGSGGNCTEETVKFSKRCEDIGADGLLVVTPYYNKCTQNGLIAHYKAIAESVKLPIITYNVPPRTGLNIAPSTLLKLTEIKNIVAVKEASGSIEQISEVLRLVRGKMDVYSGDDLMTVPAMSLGACGVISVAANVIPEYIHNLTASALAGKFNEAADIHFKTAAFTKSLFIEVNPIPCKKALELLGIKAGIPRMPLTELESEHTEILRKNMIELGLIK